MPAAILALAVAQTANAAGTADGGVAARLELDAPASCAERKDVVASVARRSERIEFVDDERDAVSFRAAIRPGKKKEFSAELVVVQSSGRRSSRRIQVSSCAEAVDALAIVIVMTLDPESSLRESGSDRSGASPGASDDDQRSSTAGRAGSESSAASAKAGRGAAAAGKSVNSEPGSGGDSSSSQTSPRGAAPQSELTAGVGAQLVSGPAPTLMLGPALQGSWGLERGSPWSPALRLTLAYHWASEFATSRGNADFALALATLDLCPVVFRASPVALRPCAFGGAGLLSAEGSKVFDPQTPSRPFALLGGSLLAVVDIGQKLQLNGNASLARNLVTDTFLFSPETFYEVPAVTLLFGLGVSYRFSVIE